MRFPLIIPVLFVVSCNSVKKSPRATPPAEPYRPQLHFTPQTGWMNDPNGMVYYNGTYHLFYQHYPDSTVWGPMHWGHATSRDLVHWQHQPIALYPDSLGYIFSGSAVVDSANTSGFGQDGKAPLVAIFTHHDTTGEKAGRNDFQAQSLAYSLDEGATWTKYSGNPVLKSPGIRDFRDPKVIWHEETKKWIMALAVFDHVAFYSSADLKDWTLESEFGKDLGAHGGVWECPDLFPLEHNGQTVWVLLVSLWGGPNGGSATQYFTGQFDGHSFAPYDAGIRWIDYGPDNYAGVTWSNTGRRKIFLGWMSNWQYANLVPTATWRSATTIPRELHLDKIGDRFFVRSQPVVELNRLATSLEVWNPVPSDTFNLSDKMGALAGPVQLRMVADTLADFAITFSNAAGEKLIVGYEKKANNYFIDRTASGKVAFEKGFAKKAEAPRLSGSEGLDLTLLVDMASVELFADGGLTAMTTIFFPTTPYTTITMQSSDGFAARLLEYRKMRSFLEQNGAPVLKK